MESVGWKRSDSKTSGVAILAHKKYDIKLKQIIANENGKYLLVKCLFESKLTTLVYIYTPLIKDKKDF